ncbi:hypothetical protein FRB99_005242 [Tulasnella sp. 403]|nr:hypothetical protein FRB99_005242 [Tulasnella sp. 403]
MATASVQHPTASWEAMDDGSVFYRKQEVYTMQWKVKDLSDYIIAGARYGGCIAILRDPHKVVAFGANQFSKPTVQIFSSSGELLQTIPWDQGSVIALGWTYDEQLVIINDEGMYRVYTLQGDYQQFSLGPEAAETGVIDAKIYEQGMVAMTGNVTLMEVKGWTGSKPLVLAHPGFSDPPIFWSLIEPDQTVSRHVEVLIPHETSILSVDSLECVDQRLSRGPFARLAVSPNGKWLALLTASGLLWVVSSDFQTSTAEFDTTPEGLGTAKQLVWCGNDAVVLTWETLVLIVGPHGQTLRYYYMSPSFAVGEIDGVKIIDSLHCDFIQLVPSSSDKVFRPGSTDPAAILFDALEHFERKSAKADENISSIRPELAKAVDTIVEAAGYEIEPYWQRRLLQAAQFGRAFLDLYDPTDFVSMGQALKVMNAARFYEIGIPITYAQYTHTTPEHLINRLTARNLHLLALRVSSYLRISPEAVLKHWAVSKIKRSRTSGSGAVGEEDDTQTCKIIVEKFRSTGEGGRTVSFAEIAKKAWESGRGRLATVLLNHEPRAAEQVPLLLMMKEDTLALSKAVDSGDTDLVYHVLLQLQRQLNLGDFFRLIEEGGPSLVQATNLLQVYAREQNRELLRDYYFQDDRRVDSACLALEDASRASDQAERLESLKKSAKSFSEDKDHSFEAKMMDDCVKLLALQETLEKESGGRVTFVGLSVNDTIRSCLVNNMAKRADSIRSTWKVPDKRFWYLKLYALTDLKDFDGLEAFAKSKRSPIGYEPFVSHLVKQGHAKQALPYVAKCDPKSRVDLYVKCGEWKMAAIDCKERGDKTRLDDLRRACPDSLVRRELDQVFASMG